MEHCLKYVWTLGDEATCWKVAHIWHQKLSAKDRKLTAFTALFSLEGEEALDVMQYAAERHQFGPPLPPLGSFKDEAEWWASRASLNEVKYYLAALFQVLPPNLKKEFQAYINSKPDEGMAA